MRPAIRWAAAGHAADEQDVRPYLSVKSVFIPPPPPEEGLPTAVQRSADALAHCAASATDPRLQRLLLRAAGAFLERELRPAGAAAGVHQPS